MTKRPDIDAYFMSMAILVASRSTCARRKVGCVIIDKDRHVLATGYNGVARGWLHCTTTPCDGAGFPSGQGLSSCQAIHAEQNALVQCRDMRSIHTLYITASPCESCLKLFLNTECNRIVFLQEYPGTNSREWWHALGREWVKFTKTDDLLISLDTLVQRLDTLKL